MKQNESTSIKGEINDEKSSSHQALPEENERLIKAKTAKQWSFLEGILIAIAVGLFIICISVLVLYLIIDHVPSLYENDQISKPLLDNRKYEIIQLVNGMKVMIISDPSLSFASVGLSINTGFSSDLKYNLYGISSLVKEVLLNNNQKNLINDLLSRYNSDGINDEVNLFETSINYEIGNDGFEKSIELFADIIRFKNKHYPKEVIGSIREGLTKLNKQFKAAPISKEIPILNLLYKALGYNRSYIPSGNIYLDSSFTIESLTKIVMKYYKDNYTGPNMKLVVLSKHSLKELKSIVIKHFSCLSSNQHPLNGEKLLTEKMPLPRSSGNLGKIVLIKLPNIQTMFKFMFIFDNIKYDTDYLYFEYLKYVFNDKLEGSLYYLLQKNNLISALCLSYDFIKENTLKFEINIQLTPQGFTRVDDVIYQTANFLKVIRKQRVNETIYEDLKKVQSINFKFKSFDSSDLKLIANFAKYMKIFDDHLFNVQMTNNYTPDLNTKYLNAILDLLTIENCVIVINYNKEAELALETLKKMMIEGVESLSFSIDKVYNLSYAQASLSKKELDKMNKGSDYDSVLKIRKTNDYVTKLTSLVEPESEEERKKIIPKIIYEKNHIQIWHKCDRTFKSPKVSIDLLFNSPFHPSNDKSLYILFIYHFFFLSVSINQELSEAKEAGTEIQITSDDATIGIYIESFSDVYDRVLSKVLQLYYNPDSSIISESIIIEYTNLKLNMYSTSPLYRNSNELLRGLLKNNLMVEFNNYDPINKTGLNLDIINQVDQSYIRAIIYGNINEESALNVTDFLLLPKASTQSRYFSKMYGLSKDSQIFSYLTEVKDIQNNVVFRMKQTQTSNDISVVANYYYIGNTNNYRDKIFIHLLTKTLKKYYNQELEKKSVFQYKAAYVNNIGSIWYFAVITSSDLDPRIMNKQMDEMLLNARKKIEQLDEQEEMYKIKESIFSLLNAKEKNLGDRTKKVRSEIKLNRYLFDPQVKYSIEELNEEFTKKVLLNKFQELFITKVKKLSLQKNKTDEITLEDESYTLNPDIPTVVTNDTMYFHKHNYND